METDEKAVNIMSDERLSMNIKNENESLKQDNNRNCSSPKLGPKWTAEQQEAINARGCNLLVAAAQVPGRQLY